MNWFGAVLTLVFLGGVLWLVETPFARNTVVGNTGDCGAQQLELLPREVTFLAFGSSRVRAGLSAELVEDYSDGALAPAYNLGRSGINIVRTYRMLRDLLDRGVRPAVIYVEVDLLALASGPSRPVAKPRQDVGVLTFGDIIATTALLPETTPATTRVHVATLAVLQKLRSELVLLLSGRFARNYVAMPSEAQRVCWRTYYDERTRRKRQAVKAQRDAFVEEYGELETALRSDVRIGTGWRAERELHYLDRIRELAEANDIALIVGRHWRAYEPPLSDESIAAIKARIPEFEFPSQQVVRESWRHFLDRTHMFKKARAAYTRWLADIAVAKRRAIASRT